MANRLPSGLSSFMRKALNQKPVSNMAIDLAEGLNTRAPGTSPGHSIVKTRDYRVEMGFVDHANPNIIHVDLQINKETEDPSLKRALASAKRRTHTKFLRFTVDISQEQTPESVTELLRDAMAAAEQGA